MRWYPLRLTTSVRHYVFGGRAIPEKVGKPGMPDGRIAETWEVNDEEGGNATVIDGSLAGLTLRELTQRYPDELVGPGWRGDRFPLVTKFVDARLMLPIQARPRGGVDAGHGASAYAGVKPEVSIAELREALFRGRYESVLRRHPVRAGDSMYLPGGTLNSFGPGTLVYEVEEPGPSPTHAMSWRVTDGAAIEAAEQRANIDALLEDGGHRATATPHARAARHRRRRSRSHLLPRRSKVRARARPRRRFAPLSAPRRAHHDERRPAGPDSRGPRRGADRTGKHAPSARRARGAVEVRGPADVLFAYVPDLERDVRAPLAKAGYSRELIASLGEA